MLLAHMRDCLDRILEYTNAERARFDASRLVQDAVIRNLQTLAESSQRLSSEIKGTEPQIPWRELYGFRNVIVLAIWALTSVRSGWSSNKTCQRSPRL
ncbi:MAG: HepT-like ribonuclease domain-containing protein [Rubrivivax sp.]